MTIFKAKTLLELAEFNSTKSQLAIAERSVPHGSDMFFQKLMETPFRVTGKVGKDNPERDIRFVLRGEISSDIERNPFYEIWVSDMAQVCLTFCAVLQTDTVSFCLGTKRGCKRYHIDNVPLRLLVTYAGKGTEWLPDDAADRRAMMNGAPNEAIVKDLAARRFMAPWDVAVFKGGKSGLLHRTPDDAINTSSILLRLDHGTFWDNILKQQDENRHLQAANA